MDRVGGTVRQGQKDGLTVITLALLTAITFSFASSVAPIHLSPPLRAVQYIPSLGHVLL